MEKNEGFGASSFLTFSIAFNVALAKWEQFSKSLLEVDKVQREKTEEYVRKHAGAFADSKYHAALNVAIDKCISKVDKFPAKTRKWWKIARVIAYFSATWGTYELFFQRSVGIYGVFLWIAPALTFVTQLYNKFRIWRVVSRTMKDEAKKLVDEQENEANELHRVVSSLLTDAFNKADGRSKTQS